MTFTVTVTYSGGGGGLEAKNILCTQNGPPISGPFDTFLRKNHLEERLLDQARAPASYTPPFLGSFA